MTEWREGGKTARLQFDPAPGMIPEDKVIHGQLVVHYDVERALDAGDVQVMITGSVLKYDDGTV